MGLHQNIISARKTIWPSLIMLNFDSPGEYVWLLVGEYHLHNRVCQSAHIKNKIYIYHKTFVYA